jgi:hypothetical protein
MIEFLMTDPWQPIGSFELASTASAWPVAALQIYAFLVDRTELKKHVPS